MHYAWVIACTGTIVLMLAQGLGRMSYGVIVPSMKKGLLLSYTQVGLIGTGNFVGYLCLTVVGGLLAVRFGTRKTIFVSLLVLGISLFLTGLSQSFLSAFSMRLFAGMGNAGAVVPMMALAASWFASHKRGFAVGIFTTGTGIGVSLIGLFGPYLIAEFGSEGWRYAWFSIGSFVFALSFVCHALLRDRPSEKGTAMYGGQEKQKGAATITILSAFTSVVGEREIWKLGAVYFMFGFSYIAYMTFVVAYLTGEGGLEPKAAGAIFAVLGLFSIPSGVLWGWVSDVIGRRWGFLLSYVALISSYLILVLWPQVPGFYLSAVIFGFSLSSIPTIMAAAVGDSVGGRLAPAALGFASLLFSIGQSMGPAAAGWIKDATGTFAGAFVLSAVASVLGAACSMTLAKRPLQ